MADSDDPSGGGTPRETRMHHGEISQENARGLQVLQGRIKKAKILNPKKPGG
jgi:hypothetical protein